MFFMSVKAVEVNVKVFRPESGVESVVKLVYVNQFYLFMKGLKMGRSE